MMEDLKKKKIVIAAIFVLLLITIPLVLFSQRREAQKPTLPRIQVQTVLPSPTTPPVTSEDVDQKLEQSSAEIQTSLDQVNNDLLEIDQIDASDDTTTGI